MSANNYISVTENENHFVVEERNVDTGDFISSIGETADLKEALMLAEEYQTDEEVEYGIRFYPNL